MKKLNDKQKRFVIPFQNEFNYLSPADLDNVMEWLKDNDYLSENGKEFKSNFWFLFIKERH